MQLQTNKMPKKLLRMLQEFKDVYRILQMYRYVNMGSTNLYRLVIQCLFLDCLNVSVENAPSPLLDVTKNENDSYFEQLPEETYVIENEIPISCYSVIAPKKKHINVLTRDIIESTIECVISQAEECRKNNVTAKNAELLVIEEFGRCLEEIRRLTNIQNILD